MRAKKSFPLRQRRGCRARAGRQETVKERSGWRDGHFVSRIAYFKQNVVRRERLNTCRRTILPAGQTTLRSVQGGPFRVRDWRAPRQGDPIG